MTDSSFPPVLDRTIVDTTDEYPLVYSAVFQALDSDRPELRVARVHLDGSADTVIVRPSKIYLTAFTLHRFVGDPASGHTEELVVNTIDKDGRLGFAVLGLTETAFVIPSWPITMGQVPDEQGGGVWAMIACPTDTALMFLDGDNL
ncbi:hypothetical protein SEA_CLOWN_77 [Gordonia phage Clown]|uniref:Uncharacterized protein n=1 Tax=Gordonia phage Clown TaxID=2759393 RepID=A0A7L7SU89_9CAUD|nr:hypothetical protein KNV25_gp77 [Gordonia phage Clown]QOC56075.1 hypothetical protein SEA_CLOWN_77 [Gordonia phage Clown]